MGLFRRRKNVEGRVEKPKRAPWKSAALVTWKGVAGCEVERRRVYGPTFAPD